MAKSFMPICLFFVVFLIVISSSSVLVSEARHLKPRNTITKGIGIFFDGLYIEAIKTGGPTPEGKGHAYANDQTLEEAKHSGPSSGGEGHAFVNERTLESKDSGPSSGGEGHAFTNAVTKNSGPSGGEGH